MDFDSFRSRESESDNLQQFFYRLEDLPRAEERANREVNGVLNGGAVAITASGRSSLTGPVPPASAYMSNGSSANKPTLKTPHKPPFAAFSALEKQLGPYGNREEEQLFPSKELLSMPFKGTPKHGKEKGYKEDSSGFIMPGASMSAKNRRMQAVLGESRTYEDSVSSYSGPKVPQKTESKPNLKRYTTADAGASVGQPGIGGARGSAAKNSSASRPEKSPKEGVASSVGKKKVIGDKYGRVDIPQFRPQESPKVEAPAKIVYYPAPPPGFAGKGRGGGGGRAGTVSESYEKVLAYKKLLIQRERQERISGEMRKSNELNL